jgi:transcriptional regulator with XRE-family HTH domain
MVGDHLRRLREARGLSRRAAAEALRRSELDLTRLELGRARFLAQEIASLLRVYQVEDPRTVETYLGLARNGGAMQDWAGFHQVVPSWFEMYLGLERLATDIRTYQTHYVPGIFQTEEYAREVIRGGTPLIAADELERRVELRLARQDVLTAPDAPEIWAVIDEGVLHRPAVNRRIMHTQLRRLLEIAELPNVTLQLMPFNVGGYAASTEPFTLFRLPHQEIRGVVYLEHPTGATYLDAPADVEPYRMLMAGIGTDAMRAPACVRRLTELADTAE